VASAGSARADLAGPLDFETAGQLSANFRDSLKGVTTIVAQQTDSGGYVSVDAPQTAWIGIYDTTPLNSSDASQVFGGPIKVHIDVSASVANASFGLFLFDSTNPSPSTKNLLALLNVDSALGSNTAEQIRFWKNTSTTSTAVTNQYDLTAISGTNGSTDSGTKSWFSNAGSSGETISTSPLYTFTSLDFIYDPTALTLSVATPNFSATLAIPAGDVINNPAIALRINDPGTAGTTSTQKIDDFSVTAVPEPGTATLLLVGLAACTRRRRKA